MSNLHKSWKEKADKIYMEAHLNVDGEWVTDGIDEPERDAYLLGAEDFQERIIDFLLENYVDIEIINKLHDLKAE